MRKKLLVREVKTLNGMGISNEMLQGAGFLSDIWSGVKKGAKAVGNVAKSVGKTALKTGLAAAQTAAMVDPRVALALQAVKGVTGGKAASHPVMKLGLGDEDMKKVIAMLSAPKIKKGGAAPGPSSRKTASAKGRGTAGQLQSAI